MAEGFALVDVAHMHLDNRLTKGQKRIKDSDRGIGQTGAVDDQAIGLLACLLDPVDQHAFVVGLTEVERDSTGLRMTAATCLNLRKTFGAVDATWVHPVEIGRRPVQEKDR